MTISTMVPPRRMSHEQYLTLDLIAPFGRTFQDTITKALGSLRQFTTDTRLRSWLFTSMRNTFHRHITSGSIDCVWTRSAAPNEGHQGR